MKKIISRTLTATAVAGVALVGLAAPASAHPHKVCLDHLQDDGKCDPGDGHVTVANGQGHTTWSPGDGNTGNNASGYGIETAHHGTDAGQPGRADGEYQNDDQMGHAPFN